MDDSRLIDSAADADGIASELGKLHPSDSREQRDAEALMLVALGERLGMKLAPGQLKHPDGPQVDIDGMDDARSVLVECWAHQGPAKGAQTSKLLIDAVKLQWIAASMTPRPRRLILCVSDPRAVRHLTGDGWKGHAVQGFGVEIEIVTLADDAQSVLLGAQRRQYR